MTDRIQFNLNTTPVDPGKEGFGKQKKINFGDGDTFANMIKKAVSSVDEAHKTSEKKVDDLVSGKTEDIHDVMISMQKASLSFQLMVEIRNKAIETYQELSRMPI